MIDPGCIRKDAAYLLREGFRGDPVSDLQPEHPGRRSDDRVWSPQIDENDHYRIGSITARKYRSSSSGVCFLRPRIHHNTISTKLPDI